MASTNKKTFNLILNKTKSFTLVMSNFAVTTSLKVLINFSTINLNIIVKQLLKTSVGISIMTIGLTLAAKLTTKVSPLVSVGKIGVSFVVKALNKFTTTINFKIPLSITVKFLLKSIVNISSGKINLVLAPVVAILRYLSTFDPQLLSSLDSSTLAQLDHS